ncbi:MAG: hypothetical protein KI790_04265 [Cyclobacteriaceae bacterium]|nr:hypothetical protein [Cyclobacteriaceae bacterium HetDA_MAG_MS6]
MMHPSFDVLKAHAQGSIDPEVQLHINDCEICQTVVDGLKLAISEKRSDQTLDDFLKESRDRTQKKVEKSIAPRQKSGWLVSAAASVSIFIASWVLFFGKEDSVYVVDQENPYPSPPVVRSAERLSAWGKFVALYEDGKYDEGMKLLEQVPAMHRSSEMTFYLGLSAWYQTPPKLTESTQYFLDVLNSESRYKDRARWYLAKCYIELGEVEKAEILLKVSATDPGAFKSSEAALLLHSLSEKQDNKK